MITMLQNKINITLINYALLMFISMGSIMSQQNEYESLIKKGNNSFEDNTAFSEQNYRKAISYSPEFVKGQYNFSNNLYKNEYYDEALPWSLTPKARPCAAWQPCLVVKSH